MIGSRGRPYDDQRSRKYRTRPPTSASCWPKGRKLLRYNQLCARSAGLFVVFTIEAHRPDLADLPRNKYWRSKQLGCPIGEVGPLGQHLVRGTKGAEIVAPLHPRPGEPVIAKPGKSAFVGADIDHILCMRGIRNLIFVGVTTDGAVQCTLRDANDRGYECLILSDATASDVPTHHADQLHTLSLAGGVYGSIASVENLLRVLRPDGAS